MESILARALDHTLKYWLKSFSRDQFKLQGHTVSLSNLDIDGDALHSSMGLPPALNVTTARVGKLDIMLPSISNVRVEPIVVQIDKLDMVLEENLDPDACPESSSAPPASSSGRGSGYGFSDKMADGMTIKVAIVNLLLEPRGSAQLQGGSTWTPPMASITIKDLILYTTNENWQVVSLKEARKFSSKKKFIYVFKKLEWESLSIDLLPHPDMFADARFSKVESNKRDDDGAKRVFFGGERFLDGISGYAYITVQRTELNDPLGLEVQLHISEAVCPALSEPGLRALLRFLTGLCACLSRGDVDPKSRQRSTQAAGCSLVSIIVDHVFFRIKDSEFQLELLMQALHFSRASVSNGENSTNLTEIATGGLFLRDTFSHPPCTLVQPSTRDVLGDQKPVPDFAKNCSPTIYPLRDQQPESPRGVPFICIYCLQISPTPAPPHFASQTSIRFQPFLLYLQEESCFKISSFLADGIVAGHFTVLPDFTINSLQVTLKVLDIVVPVRARTSDNLPSSKGNSLSKSFAGARLHVENLFFSKSPSLKTRLLDLEKDPACLCLLEGQPIDASQMKWIAGSSALSLSLETSDDLKRNQNSLNYTSDLWRCIEITDACIQVAMATPDGSPLKCLLSPPGGIVRVGVLCQQYISNTSVEELLFVLDLYAYFGSMGGKIVAEGKSIELSKPQDESWGEELMSKVPSNTAMSLRVIDLQLKFLEDCSDATVQGKTLVQFVGKDLYIKAAEKTLGCAIAVTSSIRWESVEVDCVDVEQRSASDQGRELNAPSDLRAVLWVHNKGRKQSDKKDFGLPFLDLGINHVVPFDARDADCHRFTLSGCMAGFRLGGGMSHTEALLHRFGVLGPDGTPRERLCRGLQNLSAGSLSKVFKPSPLRSKNIKEDGTQENGENKIFSHLGQPNEVDICIDLKDWLFVLEGAKEMAETWHDDHESSVREERSWHSTFRSLQIKAKYNHKSPTKSIGTVKSHVMRKYPVDFISVGVEGFQTLKPHAQDELEHKTAETSRGVNFESCMVIRESGDALTERWEVEKLKFSVDKPIEAVIWKDELQYLASLCKNEVDSAGRIAVALVHFLKLEEAVGQEALDVLGNLGITDIAQFSRSGGFDKLFSTKKCHEDGISIDPQSNPSLGAIVASLEEELNGSLSKCAALIADIGDSEPSRQHLDRIREVGVRLLGMQRLLKQLGTNG